MKGMGVQNYSTKSGGNKYHGALYEYFRNTALDTWGFFAPSLLGPVAPKTGHIGASINLKRIRTNSVA